MTQIAPWLIVGGLIILICIGNDRNTKRQGRRELSAISGLFLAIRGLATIAVFILIMKFLCDLMNTVYPRK